MAFSLLLSIAVLNAGYAFEGFGTQLKRFTFISSTLTGNTNRGELGNRFRTTILGEVPVPLPSSYLLGLDVQKRDFEQYSDSFYLAGKWHTSGRWYYYLYGMLVKFPLGTLLLFLLIIFRRALVSHIIVTRDEVPLLGPAIIVLVVCSGHTELNEHMRYVYPSLALALVWCGQIMSCPFTSTRAIALPANVLGRSDLSNHPAPERLCGVFLCLFVASSVLWHYPHQLAYFNEIAGGPLNGWRHLLGSNLDWGQDRLQVVESLI
ncbi:MAG: hypothetical protein U0941_03590 [Planctomycetaceae bacterium]